MIDENLINATSNIFLSDFLNRFKWDHFQGVFSSDSIPNTLKDMTNFSIICNLSRKDEKGTHFISIIKRGENILYLDPLAIYINLNDDIPKFIASCNCTDIIKLDHPIQSNSSWYCGYFTLFFLLFFNKNIDCRSKLEQFVKENLTKNDCISLNNLMIMYVHSSNDMK
jgi:hypothetical protein